MIKNRLLLRCFISILLALTIFSAGLGQGTTPQAVGQSSQPGLPIPSEAVNIQLENTVERASQNAQSTIPGLEYRLEQLYRASITADQATLDSFNGAQFVDINNATVRVILELDTPSEVKKTGEPWVEIIPGGDGSQVEIQHSAPISVRLDLELGLKASGAQLEAATDRYVQVLAPFGSLPALTKLPGVNLVRLPFPSQQTVGAYTSQGVDLTHASTWQAAGYDGTGVIVGVFDFGFTGWAARQSAGDLPPGARLILKDYNSNYNFNPDTANMEHGTGCAEIVYDMAPGSTIYLYAFYTEVELQSAVNDFMSVDGKRIASMSIGWVNAGPYDGTGSIGNIITAAKNDGILWFTAAGNNQTQHWSGTSTQYSSTDAIAFGTGNINAFGPDVGTVWNLPVGFRISIYLEWNDWNAARTGNQNHIDYDIELYHWNGSAWSYVTNSSNDQCSSGAYPLEGISYTVPSGQAGYYGFAVWRTTSRNSQSCPNAFGHWMTIQTFSGFYTSGVGANNSFWVNNHCNSITIPADSDDNVTVGAIYWNEDNTASLYGLETFSSLGPRNAAGGGNPGTTANKPDLVAPDGVSNATYNANNGTNYANGGAGFWGTSAATPHAAGLAATIWEDNPNFTIAQLRNYLTTHALYKANGGACGGAACTANNQPTSGSLNNRYGWGRIDANNNAPLLDASGTMSLPAIDEDITNSSGTLVSAIISSAGGDRISDVDAESYEGLAVIAVDNTNGAWQYALDGSSWVPFGSPSNSTARLLAADATTRVRFVPNANWNGSSFITFRAWDQTRSDPGGVGDATSNGGSSAYSAATENAGIPVNPVNDAPTLTPAAPTLSTINEDATTNPGATVSTIVGSSISDIDSGAVEGIAVYAYNAGNSKWQYSVDNGAIWIDFSPVSENSALLLRSGDKIRFMPNAQNATNASLSYYAWDQSSGVYGSKVNVTTRGGTSAFSSVADSVSIAVTAVNDTPVLWVGNQVVLRGTTLQFIIMATDVDLPTNTLTYSLDAGGPASDTINSSSGLYTWVTSGSDTPGTYAVTVRVIDNGTPNLLDAKTFIITLSDEVFHVFLPTVSR